MDREIPLSSLLAALLIAAPMLAFAAAPSEFALGLQDLHWGMSSEQARKVYSRIGPVMTRRADLDAFAAGACSPDLAASACGIGTIGYDYAGCSFRLSLTFYHGGLDKIRLESPEDENVTRCVGRIESDLSRRYRATTSPIGDNGWFYHLGNLGDASTSVSYVTRYHLDDFIGGMEIVFEEATDASGRRAEEARQQAEAARRSRCGQSIAVTFPAGDNNDGAMLPRLDPSLPNLSCEYPPISIRLQEEGSVLLHVRILADGNIGNAELATPDNRKRLNDAALNLVRHTLHFIPSAADAGERDMLVTFKIVTPIHGTQAVASPLNERTPPRSQ